MILKVEFDPRALIELENLEQQVQIRIIKFIKQRIESNKDYKNVGMLLKGDLSGLWKYRIGDYRLVCQIDQKKSQVLVVSVGHRKNIYKNKR